MIKVIHGQAWNAVRSIEPKSVQCCVTSPPYFGLRSYLPTGHADKKHEIGTEKTPEEYVQKLLSVFQGVREALRDDGTLWLNLGDSYSAKETLSLKQKDLIGIPWMVAFALRADGWYLRQDIIWSKPNPMPESVTDRPTKAHEYIFLFSKASRYYYDAAAIAEPAIYSGLTGQSPNGFKDPEKFAGKHSKPDKQRGHSRRHSGFNERWDAMTTKEQCSGMRNKRSVWTVATKPYPDSHFATFPPNLIRPCILAGSPAGGTVLDPFGGSGTTGQVAMEFGRKAILIELNEAYLPLIKQRCQTTTGLAL